MKQRRHGFELTTFLFVMLFNGQLLADWQLIASNTISSGPSRMTDLVITRIQITRLRIDISAALSVLSFEDKSDQIQLYHHTKTYARIPIQNIPNPASPPLSPPQKTKLDGESAELFSWTNGPEHGRTWVVPVSRFLKSIKPLPSVPPRTSQPAIIAVGSFFGSNSIVAATEVANLVAVPQSALGVTSNPNAVTNITFTVVSKLLSITETNFSDAEFEIPAGYHDATGQPQPMFQPAPDIFGNTMIGEKNLERLRKAFKEGKPVLSPLNRLKQP